MNQVVEVATDTGAVVQELDADESGQSLVEYAFILVLVVMVCIVLVTVIGHQTANFYSNISSGLAH